MHDRQPGAPDPGPCVGLLGDANNQLLDVFRGIPEHARAAGIGVDVAGAINRSNGPIGIAAARFKT